MATTSPDGISYPNSASTKKTIEAHIQDTATSVQSALNTVPLSQNYLINGAFDVWQRGTSFSFSGPSGNYTTDRWSFYMDGTSGAVVVSQQVHTPGFASISGFEAKNFVRINRTAVGTGGTYSNFQQPIEDVRNCAGQTVTYSFWAKADAARTITAFLNQDFGTGGSSAVVTSIQSTNITTSWARYSFTFNLPSISGKTISSTDSKLWAYIGTPNVVSTIDIWGIQLEVGSNATRFRRYAASPQAELIACQRYYYRASAAGGGPYSVLMPIMAQGTTGGYGVFMFPQPMRITPITIDYANLAACSYGLPHTAITGLGYDSNVCSPLSMGVTLSWASYSVARSDFLVLLGNNSTSAYIGFSAEL